MTMPSPTADLVLDLAANLAEGPVWNASMRRLHFVDITAGRIHTWDPDSGELQKTDVAMMAGCVVPRERGGLVAALANGIWTVDVVSGERDFVVAPPEHDAARCRFNDGKCDPQGRLWAGTMGLKAEPGAGGLYCFSGGTESRRALSDVTISNGLAWAPDGKTMYYIDSPTRRVDAFEFEPESGAIRRRRTAIELPAGPDLPDGCTIDAEGMLWIAHWGGSKVTRWDPQRGLHLATVSVAAPHVSSCAFGGDDLRTLYITTARQGLDPARLSAWPKSGGIFACRPGVQGRPTDMFRG